MDVDDMISLLHGRQFILPVFRNVMTWTFLLVRYACNYVTYGGPAGWDDFWILCAQICGTIPSVWGIAVMVKHDKQEHPNRKPRAGPHPDTQELLLATYVATITWFIANAFIIFSILCFLLRIFGFEQGFKRNVRILWVLTIIWAATGSLAAIGLCSPPSAFWKMQDKKCGEFNIFLLATGILEVLITTSILLLPAGPVFMLRVTLVEKLRLMAIFVLGCFAIVASLLRSTLGYRPHQKVDYEMIMYWSNTHFIGAIACACLPYYAPIWKAVFGASKRLAAYSRTLITSLHQATGENGESSHTLWSRMSGLFPLRSPVDGITQAESGNVELHTQGHE